MDISVVLFWKFIYNYRQVIGVVVFNTDWLALKMKFTLSCVHMLKSYACRIIVTILNLKKYNLPCLELRPLGKHVVAASLPPYIEAYSAT